VIRGEAPVFMAFSAWVMSGGTLAGLRRLKTATGSLVPLLGGTEAGVLEATPNASRVSLFGVPALTTPYVANNVVFGMVAARHVVGVVRQVRLDLDSSVLFSSDRVTVRLTVRLGWQSPDPAAIVRIAAA
jgi:HK97 family phage major capsid protein